MFAASEIAASGSTSSGGDASAGLVSSSADGVVVPAREHWSAESRKFDSLEQEAYLNLWRTFDRLKAIEEEVFGRFELSAQQYNALRLLAEASPGTLPTLSLAGRLVSRAPDITRLLDRLEARGLVRREREPHNRRIVQVGLTPAGGELLARMHELVRDCGARQLGHLGDDRLRALIALLKTAREPHEPRGR